MTFRTKLLAITILPVILISVAALVLIDSQSKKLAEAQGMAVEQMIRDSKEEELRNYVKLARTGIEPFYQWDNVSRLQAQRQVADVITRLTFGEDGYFFLSRSNGGRLENPLLSEIEGHGKFIDYGKEVGIVAQNPDGPLGIDGQLYRYFWKKPSSGNSAEKLGALFYLDKWDWIIGSGLYLDDIKAQIGQIQGKLDDNVRQTSLVLVVLAIGAVALTSLSLAFVRFSEQKFADARLKQLAGEIVDAQENERKRVSTELHDGISQLLVSARYSLDEAREKAANNPEIQEPVAKCEEVLSTAISEIRRISMALRPSVLDDMGLAAAIKGLGSDFEAQTGIETRVEAENVGDLLDDRQKTALYRVAQEGLANIAKHSGAKSANVLLKRAGRGVTMQIKDDGTGIHFSRNSFPPTGMGMRNMQERLENVGGKFAFRNLKGSGMVLDVSLKGGRNTEFVQNTAQAA